MMYLSDIEINIFQLNELLSLQEKQNLNYILTNKISCSKCNNKCSKNIKNYTLFLDRFNDIKICGVCSNCGQDISYIVPFGQSESFFRKATQFKYKYAVSIDK